MARRVRPRLARPGSRSSRKDLRRTPSQKGPDSRSVPSWTENGSYLVFRKLQQDVAGFRNSVRSNAKSLGISPEVLGAKIVGRFRSGCPMELTKTNPAGVDTNNGDPSVAS